MKKNTPHLLSVAALSLFLVACGDKQSTTSAPPAAAPVASAPVPDPAPPPAVATTEPAPAATTDMAATPAAGTAGADTGAPVAVFGGTPAATAPAASAPASAAGAMAPVSDTAMGKGVYDKACALCHAAGVAGAPKLGDKTDWAPRIAQGKDTLYKHAIEGYQGAKGMMPAKGGNSTLSDADVKASVDYMTSQAM